MIPTWSIKWVAVAMVATGEPDVEIGCTGHDLMKGQVGYVTPHLEGVVHGTAGFTRRHIGGIIQNSEEQIIKRILYITIRSGKFCFCRQNYQTVYIFCVHILSLIYDIFIIIQKEPKKLSSLAKYQGSQCKRCNGVNMPIHKGPTTVPSLVKI